MRRHLFACTVAGALAAAATVTAQNPPAQPPPRPQPPATREPARPHEEARMVTVEGCLVREADVPGRQPNVAERAGIGEDYILVDARVVKGSAPAGTTGRAGEAPAGTIGARGAMYEVEGIDDERLKELVGRRVRIEGRFENVDRARATPERETPADDLVEIRGTSIRPVAGECPPKR